MQTILKFPIIFCKILEKARLENYREREEWKRTNNTPRNFGRFSKKNNKLIIDLSFSI